MDWNNQMPITKRAWAIDLYKTADGKMNVYKELNSLADIFDLRIDAGDSNSPFYIYGWDGISDEMAIEVESFMDDVDIVYTRCYC